jgi:hypothetical protein
MEWCIHVKFPQCKIMFNCRHQKSKNKIVRKNTRKWIIFFISCVTSTNVFESYVMNNLCLERIVETMTMMMMTLFNSFRDFSRAPLSQHTWAFNCSNTELWLLLLNWWLKTFQHHRRGMKKKWLSDTQLYNKVQALH